MKHLFSLAWLAIAAVFISSPGTAPSPVSAAETIQQRQSGLVPKHVNAEGADKLLKANKDVVVLDIRTADEFSDGHLIGAKNIDFYAKDFGQKLGGLDKARTYLVHCAGGGRSTKSLEQFKKLGFKSVYHLDGGFNAWEEAGKPVAK